MRRRRTEEDDLNRIANDNGGSTVSIEVFQ